MFYILNAFSPSMLKDVTATVKFIKVSQAEARAVFNEIGDVWETRRETFTSAIGHEGTAKIVSNILYTEIPFNRQQISLISEDRGLIFTLSFRPEEGKVYDYIELCSLLDEGKIAIYYFEVMS